ncbi:MAG: flagellar basal body P-ring formation protein FlgA [Aquamicrobium sp.]|nr:flagellar basal body P-ring formation protein FlgA [Aquamicrobium sp.]
MMRHFLRRTLLAIALLTMAGATHAIAQETVLVTTRVIYPGETVTTDALEEVPLRRQLRNPAAFANAWEQVDGKVARRTLLPGRLIGLSSVRDAYLVETGKPVQVRFVQGILEISVAGVPLQAGAAGDLVKVRNIDSGVVFTGTVMGDGSIRVSES